MFETYYEKLQPSFGEKNKKSQSIDTDSFLLSTITKDIVEDLKNFEGFFDSNNLSENHELFSYINKKGNVIFMKETPKKYINFDEFICQRNKLHAFKCVDDSKKKLNCINKLF